MTDHGDHAWWDEASIRQLEEASHSVVLMGEFNRQVFVEEQHGRE